MNIKCRTHTIPLSNMKELKLLLLSRSFQIQHDKDRKLVVKSICSKPVFELSNSLLRNPNRALTVTISQDFKLTIQLVPRKATMYNSFVWTSDLFRIVDAEQNNKLQICSD